MNEQPNRGAIIDTSVQAAQPAVYAEDLPAPTPNPLLLVHRLMRGRYLYAIILAALLAPIGAVAGYMAMPGKFVSTSQIRVPVALDPLLYEVRELGAGAGGYERVVGNEVEQMMRPERMREAASLLSRYVSIYNEGLAPDLPEHAPDGRDWRIDEARQAASQLIQIASDPTSFRALEEDWALRSASGGSIRAASMIEAVAPPRLLTPVGDQQLMPDLKEIAELTVNDLIIDPRTARRVIREFEDAFQNPTSPRPPRGQEPAIVWDSGPGAAERLAGMISIVPPRRSEQITITAQSDDPRLATLAANAVLVTHRISSRYADIGKRLRSLEAREEELDAELRTLSRDVMAIRDGYSVNPAVAPASSQNSEVPFSQDPRYKPLVKSELRENPDGTRPAALLRISSSVPPDSLLAEGHAIAGVLADELRSIEQRIQDLQLATAINSDTDDAALEQADPLLKQLRTEQRNLELRIERAKQDLGPNHRSLRDIEAQLEIARIRADERAAELRAQVEQIRDQASDEGNSTSESLEAELAELTRRREERRRDMALVNDWIRVIPESILDLIECENERARTARLLEEVRREREQLAVEMVNLEDGRFQYFAAQVPRSPSSDKRIPLAAAGFGGAGGLAFVLIAGIGFLDRRYRYIEEIESNHKLPPVIGVLPMLSGKSRDAEQTEVASLTVHHIRNMLLLDGSSYGGSRASSAGSSHGSTRRSGGGRVITITSAGPGDGKTSVAVALGMSFAQAGYRTLVIDADLVGRGLSAHFDVRRCAGLSEALMAQPGEAVIPEPEPSATAGLSVLSSGNNDTFRPEHMAKERFSEVVEHFRSRFDVVLIDSGPLLGSLEAGLATRSADRVVLVVARGSEQRSVAAVVKRLRDAGLRRVSLVFNKALSEDIEQSVSYISMRSQSIRASDQSGPGRRTVALARTLMPASSDADSSANPEPEEAAR